MRKLDEEDIRDILAMRYIQHLKIKEIAERYNISPRRVQQILNNPVLKQSGRKKQQLPEDIVERIKELYHFGYGIPTIRRILLKEGYKISTYKLWKTLADEGVLKHYNKRKQFYLRGFMSSCIPRSYCYLLGAIYLPKNALCSRIWFVAQKKITPSSHHIDVELVRRKSITLDYLISNTSVSAIKSESQVVLVRVPPLVPPRNLENKLTKYLKKKNCQISWIPYPHEFKKLSRDMFDNDFNDIFKKIEDYLKDILGG